MATKTWLGHAPAVAQKRRITLTSAVRSGDDIRVSINGKTVYAECPFSEDPELDDTAAALLQVLQANLSASQIPEFAELTATYVAVSESNAKPAVILEGPSGRPFTVSTANLAPSADIDLVSAGSAGVNAKFSAVFTGSGTGGTITVAIDFGSGFEFSTAINWSGKTAEAVQNACISGMASLDVGDLSVSGDGTTGSPMVFEFTGDMAQTDVDDLQILTTNVAGGGDYEFDTVREGTPTPVKRNGYIEIYDWEVPNAKWAVSLTDATTGAVISFAILSAPEIEGFLYGRANALGGTMIGPFVDTTGTGTATFFWSFPPGIDRAYAVGYSTGVGGLGVIYDATDADVFAVDAGGGFKLTDGTDTTASLNASSSASDVQTELEGFTAFTSGDVVVQKVGNEAGNIGFLISFDPGIDSNLSIVDDGSPDPTMTQINVSTTGAVTEIQSLWTNAIGGSMVLNGVPVNMPANAAVIQAALGGAGVATVTGGGTEIDKYLITYTTSGDKNYPTINVTNLATGAVTCTVTKTQTGTGPAPRQWTLTLTGATGGNYRLEFRGYTTADIAYNANAATIDTELEGTIPGGSGNFTVTGTNPFTITAAGDLADEDQSEVPNIIAHNYGDGFALTGTNNPTVLLENIQEATGPNHWDNPLNWRNTADNSNAIPANGDDVIIEFGTDVARSILYGLDQATVTLNSLKITKTFQGNIGLPSWNELGYFEYRETELKIGMQGDNLILIGTGLLGSGSSLMKINTGDDETHLRIFATNGPATDQPGALMWRGTHADNTLEIIQGFVACGAFDTQAYTLSHITARGGSLILGTGGTVGDIDAAGGEIYADDLAMSGNLALRGS